MMIRLTLPALMTLQATQAAAHTDHTVHVHGSSPLSLTVIAVLSALLIGFTFGTAALIRVRRK